jgi:hypothetical protein
MRILQRQRRQVTTLGMLKSGKYSLGAALDNFWIGVALVAILGTVIAIIGAILF